MRSLLILGRRLGTESAIYGTIVYAGLIAAASIHDDDHPDVADILVVSVVTLVVFWAAHVFAGALSHYGHGGAGGGTLGESVKHALWGASGMLEALIIPSVFLVLGLIGVLDPFRTVTLSLQASVVVLGLLGCLAVTVRHARWWWRVIAALSSAALGLLIIVIKAALH